MSFSRVATSLQYTQYLGDIQTAQQNMFNLEGQITSGKRFTNMGDDPTAASQVVSMTRLQTRYTQYTSNLTSASNYLNSNDQALGSINTLINSANTLALQGANATTDAATRQNLANQVDQLSQRLTQLGNTTTVNGAYIFAGQNVKTQPFTLNGSTLTFSGDTNAVQVETQPGTKMQVNVAGGSQIVTDLSAKLATLKTNLLSGDSSALQTSLTDLKTIQTTVITTQGDNASKLKTVTNLKTDNDRRLTDLESSISDTQGVDLATSITKYNSAQVAYQASLQVLTQGTKMSLLDFIK